MSVRAGFRQVNRRLAVTATAVTLAAGAMAAAGVTVGATAAAAATQEPCDIYAAGGTPCVAAHSTTRALYAAYDGHLYQVRRVLRQHHHEHLPAQRGRGRQRRGAGLLLLRHHLRHHRDLRPVGQRQQPHRRARRRRRPAAPTASPTPPPRPSRSAATRPTASTSPPGDGYRDDSTRNIATGNNPESEYAIFDGTHYNGGCCFDYGNAETNNDDDGAGTMEAIYFGNIKVWGYGSGNGPWIMADMENGLYSGLQRRLQRQRPDHQLPVHHRHDRGRRRTSGPSSAATPSPAPWPPTSAGSGPRGYNPMQKQGAIILGIGGDNSEGSDGTFYEGVMTTGYASAATEAAVQANIVAAGYDTGGGGGSGATGDDRVRRQQLRMHGRQQRQRRQRQQGADLGLRRLRPRQNWTVNTNGTITIDGGCLDITGANYANGTLVELWTCNGGANQQWTAQNGALVNPASGQVPRRPRRQHHQRHAAPDMGLQRRLQPEVDSAASPEQTARTPPWSPRTLTAVRGDPWGSSLMRWDGGPCRDRLRSGANTCDRTRPAIMEVFVTPNACTAKAAP